MSERLATRYTCRNEGNPLSGATHTHGNGKPSRKRCAYCNGAFYVYTGLWGVFTWTGDGRYPEVTALRTFTRYAAAEAFADAGDETVVRWIYRPDA
jgi:hypothetical protein